MGLGIDNYAIRKGYDEYNKYLLHGELEKYIFTISYVEGFKYFTFPLININEHDKNRIISFLKEQKKVLKLKEIKFNDFILHVKIKDVFNRYEEEDYDLILNTVINYLRKHQICMNKACIIFNQGDADSFVFLNAIRYRIHNYCLKKEIDRSKNYEEKIKNEGSYLLGTIGALIGGIIITALWIFLISIDVFAPIFLITMLIGFVISFFYRLLGRRIKPHSKWIILSNSLLSLFSGIIFSDMLVDMQDFGAVIYIFVLLTVICLFGVLPFLSSHDKDDVILQCYKSEDES